MSLESLPAKNVTDSKVQPWISVDHLKPYAYYLPRPVRQWGKRVVENIGHKKIKKPTIDEQIRRELIAKLTPDIESLCEFCGRDLFARWQIDAPQAASVANVS